MKTNIVGLIPITTLQIAGRMLVAALICLMSVSQLSAAGPDDWPEVYFYTPEGLTEPLAGELPMQASSALACRPSLQISLNEEGWAVVTPSMMLYVLNYDASEYEVSVDDGDDTVTCADIGSELMAVVSELPTGNTCMSMITVEDKLGPTLVCENDTIPCNVNIPELDFLSFIDSVYDNCTPFEDLELTYSYTIIEFDCDPDSMAGRIDVTYTATDNIGMTAECQQSIYLKKFSLDDVVFPPDTILGCVNPDVSPENVGVPTIGGTPIDHFCELVAWSDETQYSLCSGEFKVSRMWSVMDWCTGVTITDLQSIYVKDTFPPEIACPDDITLGTDPGVCYATYTFPEVDVTDMCSDDDLIEVLYRVSGFFLYYEAGDQIELPPGDHIVTIMATDDCLTTGTCEYMVTVVDDEAPVLVCHNYSTNLNDLGFSVLFANSAQFFATDNCGIDSIAVRKMVDICGNPQDTLFGPYVTFCCEEAGTSVMVVFQAIDIYGNEQQCMIEVEVKDATPPTALCQDIMVFLDINGFATITPEDIDNGSFDNCEIISLEIDRDSFECQDLWTNPHDVTLKVTDASGNMSTCIGQVTVKDTTPPEAFCEDITVMLDSTGFASITWEDVDAGSIDNCMIVERTVDPDTFGCADVGLYIDVKLVVIDQSGNRDSCIAEVYVIDNPPTVICKDATLYLDSMGMVMVMQEDIDEVMDDCGIDSVNITPNKLDCDDVGTTEVTLTVTDIFGNTASCTSNVTVFDTIAPTCLTKDITVELDENGMASIAGDSVDNGSSDECGILMIEVEPAMFDCDDVGDVIVTQTVTDNNGNTSQCTATVTVEDNNTPECETMDITVYLDENGQVSIPNDAVDAGSSAACGVDSIWVEPNMFDCEDVGDNMVTMYVTDVNGNGASCPATVTVEDTIAPTCETVDITVYLDANGMVSIGDEDVDDGSDDNCAIESITVTPKDFTCSDVGNVTVTQTVTDVNGNVSTCEATVTVEDTVAPVCLTMDITVMLDVNGEATIADDAVDNGSNDACGIESITVTPNMFDCSSGDSVLVTQTVTDVNGNVSMCTAYVVIENSMGPEAVCQDITVYLDDQGMVSITPEDVDGGSSANCGDVTLEIDPSEFDCDETGPNMVTLTVTDISMMTDSCVATVTVLDTIAPVCVPNDVTVYLDDNGEASITVGDVDGGSSDNCEVDVTATPLDFTCANLGDNPVTITAEDPSMNVSMCEATVTVEDTIPPVCVAVDTIFIVLPGNGMASITVDEVDDGSSDNCDIESLVISQSDFTCDDIGANDVILTVTDIAGNVSQCTTVVVVEDGMNFECNTVDITVFLDENGEVVITPGDIDNGSGGGCNSEDPDLSLDITMFDCEDIGNNTVTLTVTTSSDTVMCTATVTVIDNLPPDITCPADVTVDCDEDLGDLSQFGTATAEDNCGVDEITETQTPDFDDCGQGTIVRTFTATDDSGNSAVCTQVITVGGDPFDESQIIWPPATIDLDECSSTEPEDIPGSEPALNLPDGSCAMVVITYVDSMGATCDSVPLDACIQVFRTWMVMDECDPDNEVFTFSQVISVIDNTGPMFTPIPDITVEADPGGDSCVADVMLVAMATACGMDVTNITNDYTDGGADASGSYPLGVTTVTFTATDDCCNESTLSVNVTVTDPGTPTFICFKPIVCIPEEGILEFTAADFIMFSNPDGCSTLDDYFVSFSSTDPFDQDTMFNCGNAGEVPLLLIWIWSPDTIKIDSCFGDLDINDGPPECPETNCATENLTVTGNVFNELGMPIAQTPIVISEPGMEPEVTDGDGHYEITGLQQGNNYAFGPYDDEDHLEGVSTLDLVQIQKHLLGISQLNSPYKRIAADVNGSEDITVMDILILRKALLGLDQGFVGNTSWRFVYSDFDFPNPFDPFMTEFPEEMIVGDMHGDMNDVDFVAVKIGDVNNSYTNLAPSDTEDALQLALHIEDQTFEAGEVVRVPVRAANFTDLAGYQYGLNFDTRMLEFSGVDIPSTSIVDPSNFGLASASEGMILTSWSMGASVTRSPEEQLFVLEFVAQRSGKVSEVFTLSSESLRAEAYVDNGEIQTTSVDLYFTEDGEIPSDTEFALLQNRPNPFNEATDIPVYVPQDGTVELLMHSVDGQLVYTYKEELPKGFHTITVDRRKLGASGVYYYTVITDTDRATRKMTLLD